MNDRKNGSVQSVAGSMQSVTGSKNVLYSDSIKFQEGTWWQRRSSLEKKLVFLLVICFIVALVLFVVLIVLASQRNMEKSTPIVETTAEPSRQEICTTPGCVSAAARILDSADFSNDPCENFYDYACGSFMKTAVISEERSAQDIFYLLTDRLDVQIRSVLESPTSTSEATSITQARNMYNSCLDKEELERRGSTPLTEFLAELGGWPLLDQTWNESNFRLEDVLISLSEYNQVPLIYMAVLSDEGNSSRYRIYFDQPGLGMPNRDYFLKGRNHSSLLGYEKYINEVAVGLGADPVEAKQQIAEMIDFEIEIANITLSLVERFDKKKLYNLVTLRNLSQMYPDFDWISYTKTLMAQDGVDININEDEVVVNWSPTYFEKLFPILRNTPRRVQANYLIWMIVKQRVKLLDSKFREMITRYNTILFGTTTEPPRWKVCLKYINSVMRMTVARLFADAYFDENAKTAMLDLIANLRESFDELLEEVDWMNDITRVAAREKAAVMKEKIGYPDAIKNNTYLDDLYKGYFFNASTYFENVQLESQLAAKKNLRRLMEPVDKNKWIIQPAIVNAFYYPSWNEIVFPAGILQLPFYSENQPWSLNYGGIGSVIGHEITHGFDIQGRQRDKDGNLRDWWEEDVVERFNNESNCFIEQTSRYVVPEAGLNINGKLTVGEDVADNGGVKQSYRAYQKFIAKRGKEEALLPGVPLNHNQLFFLGWGQVWCTKIRPASAKNAILTDYHSPNRYRAIAPMLNTPEFAKAFNCKKDSPMNPSDKCSVW